MSDPNPSHSSSSRLKILLLDGETRSALAVVRSIGPWHDLGVASHMASAIACLSRFTSYSFRAPNPTTSPETYIKWLFLTVEEWRPDILLPLSDASLMLTLRNEDQLRALTTLPTVNKQIFTEVSDKARLIEAAQALGLTTPKTLVLPGVEYWDQQLAQAVQQFPYPAVLKPRSSVAQGGAELHKGEMAYISCFDQVFPTLQKLTQRNNKHTPSSLHYLLQERVSGEGVGVFALCSAGIPLITFAHRRILEKPPSGGRSVLCESIALEEAPLSQALSLLRHFSWEGVAMVEFKKSLDGKFYLMEINPRFWGSLQLAIDCGRDFPALLARLCRTPMTSLETLRVELEREFGPYKVGQRLRWELGTLDHAIALLREAPGLGLRRIFLQNSLQLFAFSRRTRLELWRREDWRPFVAELRNYFWGI